MPLRRLMFILCWSGVAFALDPSLFDGGDEPLVEAGPTSEEESKVPEDWGELGELEVPEAPKTEGEDGEEEGADERNTQPPGVLEGEGPKDGPADTLPDGVGEGDAPEETAPDAALPGNGEVEGPGRTEEEEQGGEASAPGFEPDEAAREVFVPSERILPGHAVDFPWDI